MRLSALHLSLLFTFLVCQNLSYALDRNIDSLYAVLKLENEDTNKVNTLNILSKALLLKSYYKASDSSARLALQLSQKLNYTKGSGLAYKNLGNIFVYEGDYKSAADLLQKSLKAFEEIKDQPDEAAVFNGFGLMNWNQGNYSQALDYYFKALDLYTKADNKANEALVKNNIGLVYWDQKDYNKAIESFNNALNEYQSLSDSSGIARVTGNMGLLYWSSGSSDTSNYVKALEYDLKALALYQKMGNNDGIAINLSNLGNVYAGLHRYNDAIESDEMALNLYRKLGNKSGIARCTGNIGNLYLHLKKYVIAEKYLLDGLAIAKNIGELELVVVDYHDLADLYIATGQWEKAYFASNDRTAINDSLIVKRNSKQIGKLEAKADFDKQLALQQANEDKKAALTQSEAKHQKVVTIFIAAIAIALMIIAFVIFRSLRITRKQKILIEEQKKLVEDKNKDILDSITYAKRLQDAILPPLSIIRKYLPESFVLYKPKDIVAGDFYWMEKVGDNILIAACDCTGHGVPGAMVSVVCSNALNRTVKEFKITEPGKILDKVRELVLETFEKSESEVQDGMDISLCFLNTQTKEIQWCGAHNPLWYVNGGELKEIAPDKQPIGKFDYARPFNTSSVKLLKGDTLYLFTDGYADQFGGPKGKKFKYKQLQEKLLAINTLSMDKQKEMLDETIEEWKGGLEQVDDVLVIGIRV